MIMGSSQIRFRAWDGERLRKVNVIGWDDEGVDFVTTPRYSGPAEDFTLMRYTGLKDKNGIEIYEGDIVKRNIYLPGDDVIQVVGEIRYFEHEARFVFRYNGINYDAYHRLNEWVVGNIHENSHLLKENAE